MIQDTGFGGGREVYKALTNQGQVLSYGIEEIELVSFFSSTTTFSLLLFFLFFFFGTRSFF